MSLATKYRPEGFTEIYGQENVVNTLVTELKNNTIKQAYLFVGKTGNGKTSTARVLAKKLDSFIIELDAASNGSVECIKELLNTVKTRPIGYDHIVVILDEIQSISYSAFSVLLKILEHPPKHLIFILCTTEVNKIPQPIYNRCEVLDFTNISVEAIYKRLVYICTEEHMDYTGEAISMIAKLADGSMRQAITYLEQCSSSLIGVGNVKQILLADSYDNYLNLIYAVFDEKYDTVAQLIQNVNNIDKYITGLFSFVLDINIYILTKNTKLIGTPECYAEDFDNFSKREIIQIKQLRDILLKLQFEGRNNPILKQLLIATLYKFMEE